MLFTETLGFCVCGEEAWAKVGRWSSDRTRGSQDGGRSFPEVVEPDHGSVTLKFWATEETAGCREVLCFIQPDAPKAEICFAWAVATVENPKITQFIF